MSAIPMNVLMLGSDYQYPFSPLGADDANVAGWRVVLAKWTAGKNLNDVLRSAGYDSATAVVIANDIGAIPSGQDAASYAAGKYGPVPQGSSVDVGGLLSQGLDTLSNIFGKSKPAASTGGAVKTDYTPYLLIGGAALAALFLMKGTRK